MVVPISIGAIVVFSGCKRNTDTIDYPSDQENLPGITAYNSEVFYTENGKVKIKVIAPLTVYYQFAKEPYTEFPQGITVYTYDDSLKLKSTLTAKYAIYYEKKQLWKAQNNIVAQNIKGEVLNTEELYWDQKKHLIYTDVNVKIKSTMGVIYGKGMVSDESFYSWEVKKPYDGEITLE